MKPGDTIIPRTGKYPGDAYRVDAVSDGKVLAHHLGGGFQRAFNPADFRLVTASDRAPWKPGRFQIEDGPIVAGYSQGFLWNGWEQPAFELEQALSICAWAPNVTFDGNRFVDLADEDDPVYYERQIIEVDGRPLIVYPIGAGSWIWDAALE